MRKLIIIVAATLAPIAVWTAGCRQDSRQAAFPNGPEVKNLGRSAEPELASAPMIPTIIDPEVLATPDQPTFARIRAVMDREAQLAGRYAEPGLFVLPRQDPIEMAVASTPPPPRMTTPVAVRETTLAAAPAVEVPSRQFWSAPAAPVYASSTAPMMAVPGDISAMAPARPVETITPEPVLPLEAIPGVYMGVDLPEDDIPGLFTPLSSIPSAKAGAAALPSAATTAVFEAVSVADLDLAATEATGFRPPPDFDVNSLLSSPQAPAPETGLSASSGGKTLESLLARLGPDNALAPLPDLTAPPERKSPAEQPGRAFAQAAPAIPGAVAVPPPHSISIPEPTAVSRPAEIIQPISFPEELLTTKSETQNTLVTALTTPSAETGKAAEPPSREEYMTDFWDRTLPKPTELRELPKLEDLPELAEPLPLPNDLAVPESMSLPVLEIPAPPAEAAKPAEPALIPAAPPVPELAAPASILDDVAPEPAAAPRAVEPPTLEATAGKPTLVPLRPILDKPELRSSALSNIDGSVEAPPLLF